jgi:hypothetical protein
MRPEDEVTRGSMAVTPPISMKARRKSWGSKDWLQLRNGLTWSKSGTLVR